MIVYTDAQLSGSGPPAVTSIPAGGVGSYSVDNYSPWGFDVVDVNGVSVWTCAPWSKNTFPVPANSYNLRVEASQVNGAYVQTVQTGVTGLYVTANSSKIAVSSGYSSSMLTIIQGQPQVSLVAGTSVEITGTPTVNLGSGNTVTATISGTPTINLASGTSVDATIQNGTINSQVVNEILNITNTYTLQNGTQHPVTGLTASTQYNIVANMFTSAVTTNGWDFAFYSANGISYTVELELVFSSLGSSGYQTKENISLSGTSFTDIGRMFNPTMVNEAYIYITPASAVSSDTLYISWGLSTYSASTYNFFEYAFSINASGSYNASTYYSFPILNAISASYPLLYSIMFGSISSAFSSYWLNSNIYLYDMTSSANIAYLSNPVSGKGIISGGLMLPQYNLPLLAGHELGLYMESSTTSGGIGANPFLTGTIIMAAQ